MFVAPAVKIVELMVSRQDLGHGGNPVLRWNVDNVALSKPDDQGNAMPSKRSSKGKIDGVASLMIAAALANSQPKSRSYLETGDLLVL
jgi:phage terminase large subunit-like protein